jgi:DNA-binding FadR family transcriptional regulator
LRAALAANREAIGKQPLFQHTDVAFHFAIAEIPGNSIFTSLHEAVVAWLTEQRATSGRVRGADEAAYAAHVRIYEAIAAHDVAAAETAMQQHLEAVVALYWRAQRGEV